MNTLIVYYSYSGHTKAIAEGLATAQGAALAEVRDAKRPGKFKAYSVGCLAALRGKAWPILPLSADFAACDHLVLLSPVWAGNPPPAVKAALALLPAGKAVAVKMISASGESACRGRIEAALNAKGCTLEQFEDVKA